MIDVLADPHRFKVLRWHRRARKTTLGLNQLIRECCLHKDHTYAYVAPTYEQAKAIIVRDPLMLKQYLPPEVLSRPFNETALIATFRTGSILVIKGADDPDSLRGINANGVVFDEWAQMKPEIFSEIFRPILTQNGGWAQFQFTPKGRNHAWEFWRRGNNLPGYEDWKSFDLTAADSGLISQKDLDQARLEMGDDLFMQEMMCEFLESAMAVFRGLEFCINPIQLQVPQDGHTYVIGVDLGRHHDATVCIVMDISTRKVCWMDRMTETHYALQKKMIAGLSFRYNNAHCVLDTTGFSAGDPIMEDLSDLGIHCDGFKFTGPSKKSLVDGLRVAISQRLISIPRVKETEQLIKELEEFEITVHPNGNCTYSCPEGEGYYDDCVMALGLAVYGLKGDLYVAREEYDDSAVQAALSEIPVNGGYGFGG